MTTECECGTALVIYADDAGNYCPKCRSTQVTVSIGQLVVPVQEEGIEFFGKYKLIIGLQQWFLDLGKENEAYENIPLTGAVWKDGKAYDLWSILTAHFDAIEEGEEE